MITTSPSLINFLKIKTIRKCAWLFPRKSAAISKQRIFFNPSVESFLYCLSSISMHNKPCGTGFSLFISFKVCKSLWLVTDVPKMTATVPSSAIQTLKLRSFVQEETLTGIPQPMLEARSSRCTVQADLNSIYQNGSCVVNGVNGNRKCLSVDPWAAACPTCPWRGVAAILQRMG